MLLLVTVTAVTCAPQYPLPPGINSFGCANFPNCFNNGQSSLQPAQSATSSNSAAISGIIANAREIANNQQVPSSIRSQINNILASNSAAALPQVQSLLSSAQQLVGGQQLTPQERSEANSIIARARQLLSSL